MSRDNDKNNSLLPIIYKEAPASRTQEAPDEAREAKLKVIVVEVCKST